MRRRRPIARGEPICGRSSCASARVTSAAARDTHYASPNGTDGHDRRLPRDVAGGVPGARRRTSVRLGPAALRIDHIGSTAVPGLRGQGRDRRPGDGRRPRRRRPRGAAGLRGGALPRRPSAARLRGRAGRARQALLPRRAGHAARRTCTCARTAASTSATRCCAATTCARRPRQRRPTWR